MGTLPPSRVSPRPGPPHLDPQALTGLTRASRRRLLRTLAALSLSLAPAAAQDDRQPPVLPPLPDEDKDEPRLPNGKSQKDAIAEAEHEKALKDAQSLVALANQLKDDLQKAGNFTVPISALKKTEEIEKLARRIRGRLQS